MGKTAKGERKGREREEEEGEEEETEKNVQPFGFWGLRRFFSTRSLSRSQPLVSCSIAYLPLYRLHATHLDSVCTSISFSHPLACHFGLYTASTLRTTLSLVPCVRLHNRIGLKSNIENLSPSGDFVLSSTICQRLVFVLKNRSAEKGHLSSELLPPLLGRHTICRPPDYLGARCLLYAEY